jgi:hypothetical protein
MIDRNKDRLVANHYLVIFDPLATGAHIDCVNAQGQTPLAASTTGTPTFYTLFHHPCLYAALFVFDCVIHTVPVPLQVLQGIFNFL